jgi:hypothetical protein
MSQSTIGTYETMEAAEIAVRALDKGGFPIRQISIITQDMQSERGVKATLWRAMLSLTIACRWPRPKSGNGVLVRVRRHHTLQHLRSLAESWGCYDTSCIPNLV